jgi:NIMA (never in mitosis gene a)-related kinase
LKKYEFIRKIGEGGYGKIYLAKSLENGLFYAIKRISLKGLSEDELRLLNQESDVMAHLEQSDYLIKLIETFIVKDQELILVMEYAAGGDLYSKIQEHQISNEYFPEDQIVEWIYQAASGIYDMHKEGILHRDIKDENMFLTANEEIRIGDFGLCHVFEESGITNARAHSFIGTEIFMSPERLLNSKDGYDGRADVWALGVVLYELLTLKHPFGDADTSREEMNMNTVQGNYLPIPLHYSDQMFILVDGMLEKVPEYRLDIRGVLEQLSALREK